MTSDLDSQAPDSLSESLPGYVNGTASTAERKAIDDALKHDLELRRELQELQDLAAAFTAREQISAAHADHLFHRIKGNVHAAAAKKITAAPAPRVQHQPRKSWWTGWFGDTRLAWGVALAQLAVIAVLATTNFGLGEKTYDTLSAQSTMQSRGIRLNIVFAASATQQEVNNTLQPLGLRYVDGPSEVGRVVVALPAEVSSPDAVLEKLRQSKVVKFVEPLLGQPH